MSIYFRIFLFGVNLQLVSKTILTSYPTPAVYVKEGKTWKIYYICRDYLGSITHIANSDGSLKQELSYDAWGRLRNPATQVAYATGSEPALFLGRGYTGHEHLAWFGLVNMNARLYDPLLGRFLSPDPYVGNPFLTQFYNRYTYAINNPLVYIDQTGEDPITWITIGVIALFSYLKAAHDNTPKKDQGNPRKWNWLPWNWGKPDEVVFHFGSNTDGSGMYGGISAGKAGQPQPMVGYSKDKGPGMGYHHNGNSNMYYPQYDYNKPEKTAMAAMKNAYNLYYTMKEFNSTLNKAWNSDIARMIIPDVIFINGSGVLTFLGGGGADVGLALPLRGEDAGSYYLYSTLKGKAGYHLGVGLNYGQGNFLGNVDDFDFDESFSGVSYGMESDIGVGISSSIAPIENKGILWTREAGAGYGIGASFNINYTYLYKISIFKHPFSFFW